MYFLKIKIIWVLQPIVYDGRCFIQADSGKELYNIWIANLKNLKLL